MAGLLVIQLVPDQPVEAAAFEHYLTGLTVEVYDLSFATVGDTPPGAPVTPVATAQFIPANPTVPVPVVPGVPAELPAPPSYPSYNASSTQNPTQAGIVQQVDAVPESFPATGFTYRFASVAIAVVEVATAGASGNFRLEVKQGGMTLVTVPYQYERPLTAVPLPDPATWPEYSQKLEAYLSSWAALPVDAYVSVPAKAAAALLEVPDDGSPPPFDELLAAVENVLAKDPGAIPPIETKTATTTGERELRLKSTAGLSAGMSVSGTGIPAGTSVAAIGPGNTVTLSQETTGVAKNEPITFAADPGALTVAQCENVAAEIVWSDQPTVPEPAASVVDLYTDPPNEGSMLKNTTPNENESDRRQFEGQLQSYYAVAETKVRQLTAYVYALSAAIACERETIALTEAMFDFPVLPGMGGGGGDETTVILTGVSGAKVEGNFGAPAAYFYALAANMPVQVTAAQRLARATGDQLVHLLSELTTAINAGTIKDEESFVELPAVEINAAQAARRIAALGIPPGSVTPLAPAGAVAQSTSADTASGTALPFAVSTGVDPTMLASGAGIAPETTVKAVKVAATTAVTLSTPILNDVPSGTVVVFTPTPYEAELEGLVKAWLAYPPASPGAVSSASYEPGDDAAGLWPKLATTYPVAFLKLVLAALTRGFVIPAPFEVPLTEEIVTFLKSLPGAPNPPTVETLASVTVEQWSAFFAAHPTWLPPFTAPGNTATRTAAFIAAAQMLFVVSASGPSSSIVLATDDTTKVGERELRFATTAGVVQGMNVIGAGIPPGATVAGVTGTSVTISKPVTAKVEEKANITFSPGFLGSVTLETNGPNLHPTTLSFASTTGVHAGMLVSGPPVIPPGTEVQSVATTEVTLTAPANVGANVAVTFTPATTGSSLPLLQAPSEDWLASCLALYGAYVFGAGLDPVKLAAAAAAVFPGDTAAQQWLVDALVAIDALYQVVNPAGIATEALAFSVVEALYSRGLRSAGDITQLTSEQFEEALIGTVAFDFAAAIYAQAAAIAPPSAQPAPSGGFSPVNPNGELTDCIPAPCASPLGPVAYLHELLTVSAISTCDAVTPAPITLATAAAAAAGVTSLSFQATTGVVLGMSASAEGIPAGTTVVATTPASVTLSAPVASAVAQGSEVVFAAATLGELLAPRRGPLGELAASCPNLEVPLPLIDIVNECLEHLGAVGEPPAGVVYDTASSAVAGHDLCTAEPCQDEAATASCHDPARLLGALPQYSTPATPVGANEAVEPAVFDRLKVDFSTCNLPYSQALDVSRTYLRHLGSCRYEEMRTFRRCIREFVLDPANEPAGFQSWLWRYPVRIDTAIEYLGITPEEYELLFEGAAAPPCGGEARPVEAGGALAETPSRDRISLPELLEQTCLSYCEFYELWQSGYVAFANGAEEGDDRGAFPQCEPCCLDGLWLRFGEEEQGQALARLLVFVRLWRKLRESCCFCYSFAELRDICEVLGLYAGAALNPDFVRQLAAFQMLREDFRMELVDPAQPSAPGATGAERTQLLALWVGPAAAAWGWATRQLIERVEGHAEHRHRRRPRGPDFIKLLEANLDPLSRLAGFDPASPTDSWHATPTHTLRFAEVLAKIYASDFTVGELIYLFTAEQHLDDDDPFPLQEENDALDFPLGLPDELRELSLWRLRQEVLEAHVSEEEAEAWSWRRIEAALESEFGFAAADVLSLGQHLFPELLTRAGQTVDPTARSFATALAAAQTAPATWNVPADGPFQYDAASEQLSTRLPLSDREVIDKLTDVHDFNEAEQQAIQSLCFQPRELLARFALLFADFESAERHLIEEPGEDERFRYFRHQLLLCRHRAGIIAAHLSRHVAAATGQPAPEDHEAAALLLRTLAADENAGLTSWEADSGAMPALTWTPPPNGGALAALLGIVGTGATVEFELADGTLAWRDGASSFGGFGSVRDAENCPVPTVLPSLDATLSPEQLQLVSVHNGLLMNDATGAWLGGAQGYTARWSATVLVEHGGTYELSAVLPGHDEHVHEDEHRSWRAVLRRGQRTNVILSHHWEGEQERRSSALPLKPGAYELELELVQPPPDFGDAEQVRRQHTGLRLEYCGPDSDGHRVEIPHARVFVRDKDGPLVAGIAGLGPVADEYLSTRYISSLRDIRRTYQRAFKALLLVHRFALSARARAHGASELGYMLAQGQLFAGVGYYRSGGGFTTHNADFDLDFLPLRDDYLPPALDDRCAPSPQRVQALFDWWERLFDYSVARADVHRRCGRHLWHLFDEACEKQPADPSYLLRQLGADARDWPLELRYFQGQGAPVYEVTSADLQDERWTLRAWHADRWLRAAQCCFTAEDVSAARPDLWAADDPGATLPGETETGNANLSSFICDGLLENGDPRRYADLAGLNDGLRTRGRDALLSYLCHQDRVALPWQPGGFATVPRDLSDLLLLDVEAGVAERASRIEEAITAVQSYVRRARLGLEAAFVVGPAFTKLWDSEFATLRVWQACKRRLIYKENWVEWDELARARRVEAFRFLEDRLRDSQLTLAAPGGLEWWSEQQPAPAHDPLELLQRAETSTLTRLKPDREGLRLLGTPERAARASWLFPLEPEQAGEQPTFEIRGAAVAAPADGVELPYWLRAAIRLDVRFWRVDAAGVPPAGNAFAPYRHEDPQTCVSCCEECGCTHTATMDEYYFWLVDGAEYEPPVTPTPTGYAVPPTGDYQDGYQQDFYDPVQQEAALWQDPAQLPQLLQWRGSPTVRLAWCRVHNGVFQQPRRSIFAVAVTPGEEAELELLGRTGDSLTFSVTHGVTPSGYADPEAPGFRYDLALDEAITLPQVSPPPPAPQFLGTLPAYPYFVYFAPGAPLFPLSPFAPAVAIARALRAHCRYEEALRWYRLAFDPLGEDCTWVDCPEQSADRPAQERSDGACCDSTAVSCEQARDRAVLLHYVETLLEWGDALRRRHNSPEAFQQGRVLYDTARMILGPRPRAVLLPAPANPPTVSGFTPAFPPLNPRLLDIYDTVDDRLALTHAAIDAARLREGIAGREMPYFGNDPLRRGWRTAEDVCAEAWEWCLPASPYRFSFLIQKAQQYAAAAEQLGGALLAAFEKGDAEYLATLRAGQELELLVLGLEAKKDQWRDADWQVEALQTGKAVSEANLAYTIGLINAGPGGLINGEIQYQSLTGSAVSLRGTANTIEGVGEAMRLIPDIVLGAAGFGGSPVAISWIPLGTKIGDALEAVARIIDNSAEIDTINAGLDQTDASWQRRLEEWQHQTQVLALEIRQAERQILGAQRRRDQALTELNTQQRQIEQSEEVKSFLRDKFTAHELYLFLQSETLALYRETYDLALQAARQAEHAFNRERGHTARRFLPDCSWQDTREGLTAGERLSAALRHMDKAYLDHNTREREITKSIPLRLQFPAELLRLRTTGCCEIEIPEWMFDLDAPGMYMRRIKSVSLTIPCVVGPYTSVNCRLTLIGSTTRIAPELRPPAHECCCPPKPCCCDCAESEQIARQYELCPDDPRAVRQYDARQAIATSSAQNDAGLFQLSFDDPRYLPFEYMGAVSRWRIELPPENNYFDLDSLTDTILRVNYTAREGGELLRKAANANAQRHLPGDGWHLLDIRHEFPDAWQRLGGDGDHHREPRELTLDLHRRMFPFIPGGREVVVDRIAVVFGAHDGSHCAPPEEAGCPCPSSCEPAAHEITVAAGREDTRTVTDVRCVAGLHWPGMYCGMLDTRLGPLGRDHGRELELRFPHDAGRLDQVFLLCRYRLDPAHERCRC
jgi:Tc toxin complex TcA C-terminal TcB-binding domain